MAKKNETRGSKSEIVRALLKGDSDLSVPELVAAAAKKGVTVSTALAGKIKYGSTPSKAKASKKARKARVAAAVADNDGEALDEALGSGMSLPEALELLQNPETMQTLLAITTAVAVVNVWVSKLSQ